jgi:hypothetical protein
VAANCTDCDRPVGDQAFLCQHCCDDLARAIGDLPAIMDELDVTVTRQSVSGVDNGGRRSAEKPLPFNPAASEVLDLARNTITTWARAIGDESGRPMRGDGTSNNAICIYLVGSLPWLRSKQWSTELRGQISDVRTKAYRIIDKPADRVFAGPCDICGADMYCRPGDDTVTCRTPECPAEPHNVAHRRWWLLQQASETIAPTALIAKALTSLGEEVTPSMIRQMAFRGDIEDRSTDGEGRLYRVGDVISVLVRRRHGKARKAALASA